MKRHELEPPAEAALTVQEAIAETIRASRAADGALLPVKVVADLMGVPEWQAYRMACGDRKLRAEEIATLVRVTGNTLLLRVIALESGCAVFQLPVSTPSDRALFDETAALIRQLAATLDAVQETMADGVVLPSEADDVRVQVDALCAQAMRLKAYVDSQVDRGAVLLRRRA